MSTTRLRCCGPASRPCGARRRASTRAGRPHTRRKLLDRATIAREEFDQLARPSGRREAAVEQALEGVSETRVGLGLPPHPEKRETDGRPLRPRSDLFRGPPGDGRADPDRRRSSASPSPRCQDAPAGPRRVRRRDKEGNIDRILERIVPEAPAVRQAEAKLLQAQRDLAQAELNLRYCDIVSEIDGVVTSRNVNPGNNVSSGQSLMVVRSLTEIWIDANFKETQLADLRIGQRVRCEVDMYGGRREFEGRITGFTMGTGQTLSLLPAQNATGNFVKIVQRLPVRIELTDYDPGKAPLFVGLSVTPYVYFKEPATGRTPGSLATEPPNPSESSSRLIGPHPSRGRRSTGWPAESHPLDHPRSRS